MKRVCLLLLGLSMALALAAQQPLSLSLAKQPTYVYTLDSVMLRMLITRGFYDTLGFFNGKCDTFNPNKPLNLGYALKVQKQERGLSAELLYRPPFFVRTVAWNNHSYLFFTDTTGLVVPSLKVYANGKLLPYNESNGSIKIQDAQHGLRLFVADPKGNFAWFVCYPNFQDRPEPRVSDYSGPMVFSYGYAVCSQPRYRPLDSVHVKAYIQTLNGFEWKGKVKLMLNGGNLRKEVTLANLNPISGGAYVHAFKLGDSLQVDQTYTLTFLGKDGSVLQRTSFRLEDYTLKQNTYEALPLSSIVYKGESLQVVLRARDANGLPLLNARANITIGLKDFHHFTGKQLFIPQRWQSEYHQEWVNINPNQETVYTFPDSLRLPLNMTLQVQVNIFDGSGESRNFVFDVQMKQDSSYYNVFSQDGQIKVSHMVNGKSQSGKATLEFYDNQQLMRKDTFAIPLSIPYPIYSNHAKVYDEHGNLLNAFNLFGRNQYIYLDAKRTHHEVNLKLVNPLHYPVFVQVYRYGKLILESFSDTFVYSKVDTSLADYQVICAYTSKEGQQVWETLLPYKDHELEISANMPSTIYPGQELMLDIAVKDAYRKPAPFVNLTAYALNAQFGISDFEGLYDFHTPLTPLLQKQNLRIEPVVFTGARYQLTNPSFHTLIMANLWQLGDFRLMHPNEEIVKIEVPNQQAYSAIMPIAVKNGQRQTLYAIVVDKEYRYFNGNPVNASSGVVAVKPGFHTLSVRTFNKWFTLPKVWVNPNSTLFISFDISCYQNGIDTAYAMHGFFDKDEVKAAQANMLKLSYKDFLNNAYLVQGNKRVGLHTVHTCILTEDKTTCLAKVYGPFAADTLFFEVDEEIKDTIVFNPQKQYSISKRKLLEEDLVPWPLEDPFANAFLSQVNGFNDVIGELAFYEIAKIPNPNNEQELDFEELPVAPDACDLPSLHHHYPKPTTVKLQIVINEGNAMRFAHLINKENALNSYINLSGSFLRNSQQMMEYYVHPGTYTLLLQDYDYRVLETTIEAPEEGTLYLMADTQMFINNCKAIQKLLPLVREINANFLKEGEETDKLFPTKQYMEVRQPVGLSRTAIKQPYAELRGYLYDENGHPLSDAVLTLERGGNVLAIGFSDVSGGFLLRSLATGNKDLRVTAYGQCLTVFKNLNATPGFSLEFSARINSCGFSADGQPLVFSGKLSNSPEPEATPALPLGNRNKKENALKGNSSLHGKVTDKASRKPLDYVNITIKNSGITVASTITDDDGEFRISGLNAGVYKVFASYVGYKSVVIDELSIQEGSRHMLNFAMEGSTSLNEVVISTYSKPRIDPAGVKGSNISSKELLSSGSRSVDRLAGSTLGVESRSNITPVFRGSRADGTAYYIDGVRVNSAASSYKMLNSIESNQVKEGVRISMKDMPATFQLRSNFKDCGFWEPNLVTNAQGMAHVKVKFPDNITAWNTIIIGMNTRFMNGTQAYTTRAYKPVLARLFLPSFLRQGDEILLNGQALNYTEDTLETSLLLKANDSTLAMAKVMLGSTQNLSARYNINKQDTLKAYFELKLPDGYGDAEQYKLPIKPWGLLQTQSKAYYLNADTSIALSTDTIGQYSLIVTDKYTALMREEIMRLKNYQYGCVEQTTSKLNALLCEKKLCLMLGDTFGDNGLIKTCLNRLASMQQKNGGWAWYSYGNSEDWLSHYVLVSMAEAIKMGYKSAAFDKGVAYCQENLNKGSFRQSILFAEVLLLAGRVDNAEAAIKAIKVQEESLPAVDRLRLVRLKLKLKQETFEGFLYENMVLGVDSMVYWKVQEAGLYQSNLQYTLMAYEVLSLVHAPKWILTGIRRYFVRERMFNNHGLNTLDAARMISVFATDIAREEMVTLKASVNLGNGNVITKFPARVNLNNGTTYTVSKQGSPVTLVLGKRYFETQPVADTALYEISTRFVNRQKARDSFESGSKVNMIVTVTLRKDQEYVMLQLPIPAGFEHDGKPMMYNAAETEYYKERVLVFYRKLPRGMYTLNIPLEARYPGSYGILPAQAEDMYNPVLKGNAAAGRVVILPQRPR